MEKGMCEIMKFPNQWDLPLWLLKARPTTWAKASKLELNNQE